MRSGPRPQVGRHSRLCRRGRRAQGGLAALLEICDKTPAPSRFGTLKPFRKSDNLLHKRATP
ncbi:Uncharacterised protein [Pseudomonas aeruginosa]|nr:Uncharacterised protein [Pseudomonas aeruginosa]